MQKHADQNSELYEFFISLDRTQFVSNEYKERAHNDEALPIGFEQTISQPSLVYAMTQALDLNKNMKVLEIGTGSGYQTTLLAQFAREVYTVERIKELSWKAVERLMKLGYKNVNFKIGDGSEGWVDFAPYDRIIVTAAAGEIPQTLIEQLKPGGKMLIPFGPQGRQELLSIEKNDQEDIKVKNLGIVTFVEFKGKYGWKS